AMSRLDFVLQTAGPEHIQEVIDVLNGGGIRRQQPRPLIRRAALPRYQIFQVAVRKLSLPPSFWRERFFMAEAHGSALPKG
ncbi:hypothetical protein CTI14_24465, partial [Methylobacterium radiotolerans]